MKKLFSAKYSAGAVNAGMFILRVGCGILLFNHGYQKITHFSNTADHMPALFGLSGTIKASLVIFAEFFCTLLVMLGLFTRLACVPIVISLGIAVFKAHNMDVFGQGQAATLFLVAFAAILIIGPGKASVDGMIGK